MTLKMHQHLKNQQWILFHNKTFARMELHLRTSVLLYKPLNDYCYPSDKICKPMDQYPIAESSYLDGDWKVIIGVSQYNLINDRPDPFLLEWLCVKGLENLPWDGRRIILLSMGYVVPHCITCQVFQ